MQPRADVRTAEQPGREFACPVHSTRFSAAMLADILNVLDVPFVQSDGNSTSVEAPEPALLLTALASSDEARLRSALIPLLLRHPEHVAHAEDAVRKMAEPAHLIFICYYSAACFLQRKYRSRLATLLHDSSAIPDLFSAELGLPNASDPDVALRKLAERHRILSGKPINWLGTYEHAAQRWMTHMERRQSWTS